MEAICQICGEPMPKGEEMFNYHGYSGKCPKPPLPKTSHDNLVNDLRSILHEAEQKQFHDFENDKYPMPKMSLVMKLQEIIDKAKNGEYDD